ncbi:glutathione S-transferase [Jannaschia sp. Os4]|uniref:glutathione S-transferase n=1 Tax=Jannaschia sp. Os4 TaxID=2807617 RepID=UPI00193A4D51|nr:glutathione S-transferase [Jannaschia sp. Os4]MBM2575755.1 glutathione S-transferase [Jannaschia sp. Os4]
MTYDLLIGDRSYSSWSLRGWLMFAAFDIPVRVTLAEMYDPGFHPTVERWSPGFRTVPLARTEEGAVWSDTLAIAEGLAEAHPEAGHWPADPAARGLARSMAALMHSGFGALRSACPMNLRVAWRGFAPDDAVRADLATLEALWARARAMAGDGPWLFGPYGAVDAMFAPVAMRIAGYGLPVGPEARAYVDAHLAHAPLRAWRAEGEAADRTLDVYDMGLETAPFPIQP